MNKLLLSKLFSFKSENFNSFFVEINSYRQTNDLYAIAFVSSTWLNTSMYSKRSDGINSFGYPIQSINVVIRKFSFLRFSSKYLCQSFSFTLFICAFYEKYS